MARIKNGLVFSCLMSTVFAGSALVAQQKPQTNAPVAGVMPGRVGVTVEQMVAIARGWSVKKSILDKAVVNDKNEKLGKVEDIIISPDKTASYAIVGVGGFLGVGKHDTAIPISQLTLEKDRFVLPGATKDVVKAMPKFEYATSH